MAVPAHRGQRLTARLRLEPIGLGHVDDLWRLHQDEGVAEWYGGRWTESQARQKAERVSRAWDTVGVQKWMAYERATGELIGRGGLSRVDDEDTGWASRIAAALPDHGWEPHRLEVGWVVRQDRWGQGYATEIGRAGLAFAFGEACEPNHSDPVGGLGAAQVVAFTERHNKRSEAVMVRLGMHRVGEIAGHGLVEGRPGVHPDAPFVLYTTRISHP